MKTEEFVMRAAEREIGTKCERLPQKVVDLTDLNTQVTIISKASDKKNSQDTVRVSRLANHREYLRLLSLRDTERELTPAGSSLQRQGAIPPTVLVAK